MVNMFSKRTYPVEEDPKNQFKLFNEADFNGYGLYRVLVVDIRKIFSEGELYEVGIDNYRILRRLKSFVNDSFITSTRTETGIEIVDEDENSLILLMKGDSKEGEAKRSIRVAETICGYLVSNEQGISVVVGIGSPYLEPSDIWKSYDEAKKSIRICEKVWGRDRLVLFEELGIYQLISGINSYALLKIYYDNTVGKISDRDLFMTLKTYLECNESLTETANALFIHPNTVKYRLKQVKKVTGLDPSIAKDRLQLYMGLMIAPLLGVEVQKNDWE